MIMNHLMCLASDNVVSQSLEIMWKGMVSIFAVIIILTLLVYGVTKIFKDPEKKDPEQ